MKIETWSTTFTGFLNLYPSAPPLEPPSISGPTSVTGPSPTPTTSQSDLPATFPYQTVAPASDADLEALWKEQLQLSINPGPRPAWVYGQSEIEHPQPLESTPSNDLARQYAHEFDRLINSYTKMFADGIAPTPEEFDKMAMVNPSLKPVKQLNYTNKDVNEMWVMAKENTTFWESSMQSFRNAYTDTATELTAYLNACVDEYNCQCTSPNTDHLACATGICALSPSAQHQKKHDLAAILGGTLGGVTGASALSAASWIGGTKFIRSLMDYGGESKPLQYMSRAMRTSWRARWGNLPSESVDPVRELYEHQERVQYGRPYNPEPELTDPLPQYERTAKQALESSVRSMLEDMRDGFVDVAKDFGSVTNELPEDTAPEVAEWLANNVARLQHVADKAHAAVRMTEFVDHGVNRFATDTMRMVRSHMTHFVDRGLRDLKQMPHVSEGLLHRIFSAYEHVAHTMGVMEKCFEALERTDHELDYRPENEPRWKIEDVIDTPTEESPLRPSPNIKTPKITKESALTRTRGPEAPPDGEGRATEMSVRSSRTVESSPEKSVSARPSPSGGIVPAPSTRRVVTITSYPIVTVHRTETAPAVTRTVYSRYTVTKDFTTTIASIVG